MASTVASPGARKPSKRLGMPCEVCAVLKSNRLRSSKTDAMALAEWRGDLQSWSNPSERLGPALEVCTILKSDCFKDRCHGACQMDQSWSSDPQAVTSISKKKQYMTRCISPSATNFFCIQDCPSRIVQVEYQGQTRNSRILEHKP